MTDTEALPRKRDGLDDDHRLVDEQLADELPARNAQGTAEMLGPDGLLAGNFGPTRRRPG
jgi:hypothetical protein